VKKIHINFLTTRGKRRYTRFAFAGMILLVVLGLVATFVSDRERSTRIPIAREVLQSVKFFQESSLLPTILGFPKSFTVLLLFQNSGELRPTGGFIGTVGILRMSKGKVEQFWTDDVYRLDGYALKYGPVDQPPDPLSRYLGVHDWGIRDANWDPDFPSSARLVVSRFMERGTALSSDRTVDRIDAVVAITPELIARVLGVLGQVELEGRTFTRENFHDELQEFVEIGYKETDIEPWQRKNIIGDMARVLFERLATDYTLVPMLLPLAQEAIVAKDFQAFAFDEQLQNWITRNGASGALPKPFGDALGVFDANLASFKTDTVIERTITYTLRGRTATVTLRYKNNGAFTWKTTRYRTYTRVYAALGSRLLKVRGALQNDKTKDPRRTPGIPEVTQVHGYTVFGAFTSIEPQRAGTLSFTYELPDYVVAGPSYTLSLIKQAGTGSVPLTLDLEFGKTIRRAEPEEQHEDPRSYKRQTALDRDATVTIEF